MAKFEELKPNFLDMDFDERMQFIIQYTEKRMNALTKKVVVMNTKKACKSTKKKDQKVAVTVEQMQLLQSLGLI